MKLILRRKKQNIIKQLNLRIKAVELLAARITAS